jgi:hypothetical protein
MEKNDKKTYWLKFRWEFIRRNKGYQELYSKALDLRRMSEFPPDSVKRVEGCTIYPYLSTPEGKKVKEYCDRFGLYSRCMIDPSLSFSDLMDGPDSMERACFWPATFYDHFAQYQINGTRLTIEVDLSKVNSFGALKDAISKLLGIILNELLKGKKIRRHFLPGGQELRSSKDYEFILSVGGHIEKKKRQPARFTYKKAAQEYFPGLYKKRPEVVEKTVRNAYKDYLRLVEGGYLEITYP